MTETGFSPSTHRGDWWSRRPRRSRTDSKVAGVAGGLAHHLGVDPILFRVGFVALTIIGGVGFLAYALLWLLLPAEGDEVSAGEALLGRGRSSVSPIVAAVLALVVVVSVVATTTWGFPFWPAIVIGAIAFHVARKQRRGPFRPGGEWERRVRSTADDVAANRWSDAAGAGAGWGDPGTTGGQHGWGNWGSWGGGCSGHGAGHQGGHGAGHQGGHGAGHGGGHGNQAAGSADSPFDTPAFWDVPDGGSTATAQQPADPFRPSDPFRKADPFRKDPTARAASEDDQPTDAAPRTTPPAWDPLGAAPFAWDLPDIDVAPKSDLAPRTRTPSPVIARATMGLALLVIAVEVLGLIAGWWSPAWAVIAASALTVIALGLLVQALRGRSLTLIGQGVLFSFLTVALSLTGVSGTPSVGDHDWHPTTAAQVQSEYRLSAGNATLDLSTLTLAPGDDVVTSLTLGAGEAHVVLPAGVDYTVTCSSNAGQIDCLDNVQNGLDNTVGPLTEDVPGRTASVTVDVHVGAGEVTVSR